MFARFIVITATYFVALPSARADWSALPTVTGGGACRSMAFADESHGYLIVDKGTTGSVFVTSDGGQTFTQVPSAKLPTKNWTGLFVLGANVAFVSALGVGADKKVIAETVDGGANWTQQTVTTTNGSAGYVQLSALDFVDALHGFAGGSQDETGTGNFIDTAVMYETTDGGTTWLQTGVPSSCGKGIVTLAFTDAMTGVSVCDDSSSTTIYRTANAGAGWTSAAVAGDALRAIRFVDAMNGFGFTDAQLLVTSNAGAAWTALGTAPPPPRFNGESFLSSQAGLVNSNGATSPWLWRTLNGGTSWQPETTPSGWQGGVACLAYASTMVQFAASSDGSETRPLKFTPMTMTDAGTGLDAASNPDAATSNLDAGTGPKDNGGATGCGCRAANGSVPTALLAAVVAVVVRRRRKPRRHVDGLSPR